MFIKICGDLLARPDKTFQVSYYKDKHPFRPAGKTNHAPESYNLVPKSFVSDAIVREIFEYPKTAKPSGNSLTKPFGGKSTRAAGAASERRITKAIMVIQIIKTEITKLNHLIIKDMFQLQLTDIVFPYPFCKHFDLNFY